MSDPYAHLTPKPLDQQVPGAWNFVEPDPKIIRAEGLSLRTLELATGDIMIDTLKDTRIRPPAPARFTLSPEAREKLMALLPYNPTDITLDDEDYWERFAMTLVEICFPYRYVVGLDAAAGDPGRP